MIDIQLLRANLDAIAARLATRGYVFDKEGFLSLENERKQVQTETQNLQASKNAMSKRIGQAKAKGEDIGPLMAEANAVNERVGDLEKKDSEIQRRLRDFLAVIPNPPHESVPTGKSADDNVEQRRWGTPRAFDFPVKDHVDVGETLGQLDFAAATKIAGARFALMKGGVARMHRAIAQLMLDVQTREHG